jgi:integrase
VPAAKDRSVQTYHPAPNICVAALRERMAAQSRESEQCGSDWLNNGLVFTSRRGTPIAPRNYTRDFRALCERAGVPTVRLHDLRHTCVSLLLALGTDPRTVMEIVGHSGLDMTMNVTLTWNSVPVARLWTG